MFSKAKSEIIIVSPWIKYSTLQKVIDRVDPNENIIWKVLTRNNHDDFLAGFSDIDAFKLMVENNAFDLRAIRQLHAKVYIVDGVSSLVTSANLTVGGMEINTEAGIASTDPNEVSELLKEFKIWFDQANLLDELWLVEEQQKLLESKKQEWIEIEIPFDPADYPNLEEGEPQKTGKYRELPLPTVWIPVLDSLRETETPTDMDYLLVNDLVSATIDFFEYVKSIPDGKRIQGFLVNWLIHKQTFEFIGDEKISRERVSQKIGKRKNNTENIWNSIVAENFTRQISLFFNNVIGKTDIKISDVLSSEKLQPLGLSHLDLCQFVCGMVEKEIVVGNCHAEITPTNQLLVCNKEIYNILKKLDNIFQADYQEFMDLEKFCRLGELEDIANTWFYSDFKLFKNLYITKNRKIGSRNWSIEKLIRAIAWELADKIDYYHWHFSEMREALNYLFPARFGKTSVR
ncbi:MAG TPA: hypothetical protein DCQ58_02425, partial [Saprospirales bacterium]|nr:hypothetical protein [Saprospirales bacterium]